MEKSKATQTKFKIELPSRNILGGDDFVESSHVIVVIGANGSGKSKLGAWIDLESPYREKVHRISAQRKR